MFQVEVVDLEPPPAVLVDAPSSPEPYDVKDLFASDDPVLQAILDKPVFKKCKITTKSPDPTFNAKELSSVLEPSADISPKAYADLNKALKLKEKKPVKEKVVKEKKPRAPRKKKVRRWACR